MTEVTSPSYRKFIHIPECLASTVRLNGPRSLLSNGEIKPSHETIVDARVGEGRAESRRYECCGLVSWVSRASQSIDLKLNGWPKVAGFGSMMNAGTLPLRRLSD
jgi:hypothetical protein